MLKQRIMSGVLLGVAATCSATLLPSPAGWFVILALGILAQYEFYGMMREMGVPVFRWLGLCGGMAVISTTFWTIGFSDAQMFYGYVAENLVLTAIVLLLFVRQAFQKDSSQPVKTVAITMLGILYGPYLLNYLTRLAFHWHEGTRLMPVGRTGQLLILYLIAVVKASDMGAYFTGRFLGRHKLIPRLSPNKTWEGLVGGIVLSLVVSLLFWWFSGGALGQVQIRFWDAAILGIILAGSGVIGDLVESMIKRDAAIKDSGHLIPGMGGVLDVLDSLLFGAPILYAYVVLILHV